MPVDLSETQFWAYDILLANANVTKAIQQWGALVYRLHASTAHLLMMPSNQDAVVNSNRVSALFSQLVTVKWDMLLC